ncbi:hypothetical protein ITI46_10230 [Streptomyces oryzae]|uniref:Uncharacterized protein n=1 Tax=Streptomyces oryzae TaxID=1434886 RepID=A0ABS3X9I1_9ACTN|nr:hypothetical protein [Streptomyces oryzae]MBO8192042.1 hypothetical protein [Streptomyces oryzae]
MSVLDISSSAPARQPASMWATLPEGKKVLVVVHTEVYGKRLQDLLPLLESDLRLEVAFTVAPHAFNEGAMSFLRSLGATVLSWEEAVRTEFDLALAAGSRGTEQLNAPLVRVSHGAGHLKLTRAEEVGPGEPRAPGGITGRGYLTWKGRIVPKAVALPHRDDLAALERWCPEALPAAEVVGDPCYDRIRQSLPLRETYRRALGLAAGQKLVMVTSTWGHTSSFNRIGALLPRLLSELPQEEYRVAVLVHPNVWSRYGAWQVRAWLAGCAKAGFTVLPPEADWRQPLIAADWLVGDYGSVTLYGTITPAPILLTHFPHRDANPASPGIDLALTAPALSSAHPLCDQLAYAAAEYPRADYDRIAGRISSEPGLFSRNFRRLLYRVLGLGQPACPPVTEPLPLPPPLQMLGQPDSSRPRSVAL